MPLVLYPNASHFSNPQYVKPKVVKIPKPRTYQTEAIITRRGGASSFSPAPSPFKERGLQGERFNINNKKKITVIIEHEEDISSNFEGTIIDIETVGGFLNQYLDSRRYKDIQLVIFGFINRHGLHIFCTKGIEAISELKEKAKDILGGLQRPFYAFNTDFERGVFFYALGKEIDFDGELQKEKFESKVDAVRDLDISNYDDPFYSRGFPCIKAWKDGEFDKAIAHNRACLLTERDILIKRGFREPDKLRFVR